MSAGLTVAMLLGATGGLGITLIVRELLPSDPQLASALDRLAPTRSGAATPAVGEPVAGAGGTGALEHRVGIWAQRHLSGAPFVAIPTTELLLLRIPVARHLGQKVLMALLGLLFPAVFVVVTATL